MLCSNCSSIIKPVVALDVDGTLGDYHGHFLRFAADWVTGEPLEDLMRASLGMYDGGTSFGYYCCELFGIDLATFRQIKLAYRQGGMKRTMPIYQGARSLANHVRRRGAELFITTTRPYLSLDTVVPDTVEWCNRHGIAYDAMLFDDDKYAQLAERVDRERVVAIVDDIVDFLISAEDYFPFAGILRRNSYNTATEWEVVEEHLPVLETEIGNRISRWYDEYRSSLRIHREGHHSDRRSEPAA